MNEHIVGELGLFSSQGERLFSNCK